MKTNIPFSRALAFLPGFKARSTPPTAWRLDSVPVQHSLSERIVEHLADYSALNLILEHGTPLDQLPEARRLIQDANALAKQVSAIEDYEEIEPLAKACEALLTHWQTNWGTGGISAVA